MIKKSYAVQLNYDVSNSEKELAKKSLICFDHAVKKLDAASEHLNILKTPFKDNPEMTPEDVVKVRASLRLFKDKSIDNFNNFKDLAFNCVNIMQAFSSDTQTIKLMKSFISAVDILETKVNDFVSLFLDLESKSFASDIVKNIEAVQKECESVSDVISDRIKNHIQSNILAASWVDNVGGKLNKKIEQKTPLLIDLFNNRQDQLSEAIKGK
jgi:hypothetical protein